IKDFAYRFHRMITSREGDVLAPLLKFETAARQNRLAMERAEEQRRREEADRLAEEARIEEQQRLILEAEYLRGPGETESANQVVKQAETVQAPVIVVQSALPSTKGVSSREHWQWRPTGGDTPANRARSVDIVAAWCLRMKRDPSEFLALDDKKLNAFARAH